MSDEARGVGAALTLETVSGSWSNVVGGTNVGFFTVGEEAQVRWGVRGNGDQSGLGFSVNETLNDGGCPVGSPPCADIIDFPSAFSDETFYILGVPPTLEILGFQSGDQVVHEFISAEGGTNSAVLAGRVTTIPEPSTGLLVMTGMLELAAMRRRAAWRSPSHQ